MDPTPLPDAPLGARFAAGAAWMVAMRWSLRLLGLASTVVLARLLAPEDFGLVAMAVVVMGFVEVWFEFGIDTALIQRRDATRADWDTAWTLRLAQGLAIAAIVLALAPLAAAYYDDPRVAELLPWLVLGVLATALANIGVVAFRKELEFAREFRYQVAAKVGTVAITLGAAWWLRSYWALVIGMVAGAAFGTLLSYLLHPYRPRPTLAAFDRIWSFSKWMFVYHTGHYAEQRTDELLIGGLTSADRLGLYNVASSLAMMPSAELSMPFNRALLPVIARLQDDTARLRAAYLKALGAISTATWPAGIGFALVAEPAVGLLLGATWLPAVPFLQVLAVYGAVRSTYTSGHNLLLGTGRPATAAALVWLQWGMFLALALAWWPSQGLLGIALAKLAAAGLGTVATYVVVGRVLSAGLRELLGQIVRPAVAAAVMAGVVLAALPDGPASAWLTLVLPMAVGAVTYTSVLIGLWFVAGRPDGVEARLVNAVQKNNRRAGPRSGTAE